MAAKKANQGKNKSNKNNKNNNTQEPKKETEETKEETNTNTNEEPTEDTIEPTETQPELDIEDIDDGHDVEINDAILELESEIIEESIKITTHQVTSCYDLVQKTKELLELRKKQ